MSILSPFIRMIRRFAGPPDWYNLRNTTPVSSVFGLDRGIPIDRYYIEKFLQGQSRHIRGTALEIAENTYSKKYGIGQVTHYEVLHFTEDNPIATIIGDLSKPETLPSDRADCFICTQTFNFIYDFRSAIAGAHQLIKPGGILLATVSGISQISRYDMDRWGDYWRFTTRSIRDSFEDVFGAGNVDVGSFGNVLTATSFLQGITSEELTKAELDYVDENYQVTITIIARKK